MLGASNAFYDFRYNSANVSPSAPRVVHVHGMQSTVRTPTSNYDKDGHVISNNSIINTDIDIGEGQKIVVGKSTTRGSEDG